MPDVSLEAAQELHMNALKIDGHNDTPVERVARGERPMDLKPRDEAYHCDIPRMKEGGYTCGFFIVGNGAIADIRVTTEQILQQVEQYPRRPDARDVVRRRGDGPRDRQGRRDDVHRGGRALALG